MHVENEASALVHYYYCVLVITVASCFSYVLWSILLALNEDVTTKTDKGREWERNVKSQTNFQERRKECRYSTARASMVSSSQRVSFSESSAPPNSDLNNDSVNCREKNEDQGHATARFYSMGVNDDKRHLSRDACQQLNDLRGCVTPQRQKRESLQAWEASRPPGSRDLPDGYLAVPSRGWHNLGEDGIPSVPHDSSSTLKQLACLAQQLDELTISFDTSEHPRSFEDACSASKILSRSASFSELANRTCQHLNISKFDLWRNKPLWTSLKKTWELNKLRAAEHEASMDVIVRKKHDIYAATMEAMEADSPLDQGASNSFAEKERHNSNAPVTGHLLSRMSGSHPAAVMTPPRASGSNTSKPTSKPSSSITLWIPSPSPALTPAPPSQECTTLDFVARDRTTPQHTPSSPATPVMSFQGPMYATNVLTTDAFRRVIQDKTCRYLS